MPIGIIRAKFLTTVLKKNFFILFHFISMLKYQGKKRSLADFVRQKGDYKQPSMDAKNLAIKKAR